MRVGEFRCIFSFHFHERISPHEEPDKLQYGLFGNDLASMYRHIVSH
jgi:hypothetical protein